MVGFGWAIWPCKKSLDGGYLLVPILVYNRLESFWMVG